MVNLRGNSSREGEVKMKYGRNLLYRTVLTISLFVVVSSLMVLPWVDKDSGSYIVLLTTLLLNLIFSTCIVVLACKKRI